MPKISRNAPCPCGSGKKYKRCCLPLQKGHARSAPQSTDITAGEMFFEDDIDQLSNSVLDLIQEGKLDEAETLCRQLSKQYPDQVDGIERMAMVEEARGHYSKAAQYYLQAASFIHGKPGFDPLSEPWYRQMAEEMKRKAAGK